MHVLLSWPELVPLSFTHGPGYKLIIAGCCCISAGVLEAVVMQVRFRYNSGSSRNDNSMMHYGYIQNDLDPPLLACMDRADGDLEDKNSCDDDDSDCGPRVSSESCVEMC